MRWTRMPPKLERDIARPPIRRGVHPDGRIRVIPFEPRAWSGLRRPARPGCPGCPATRGTCRDTGWVCWYAARFRRATWWKSKSRPRDTSRCSWPAWYGSAGTRDAVTARSGCNCWRRDRNRFCPGRRGFHRNCWLSCARAKQPFPWLSLRKDGTEGSAGNSTRRPRPARPDAGSAERPQSIRRG